MWPAATSRSPRTSSSRSSAVFPIPSSAPSPRRRRPRDAAKSPVTALAGNIFNSNVLSKLKLGAAGAALLAFIPKIMGGLKNIIKDQDGDGDVDLNDVLLTLKGSSGSILGSVLGGVLGGNKASAQPANTGGSVLGNIAGSVLGGLFGKKK